MSIHSAPKILIIRRDNIGDLVCTTPLIAALRRRFPEAWLGALVNSYNAPVLDGNPDLDEVLVYTKAKHRGQGESLPGILWRRLLLMQRLRRMQLDDVIIATTSPQPRVVALARWLRPKRIIGFGEFKGLDVALPLDNAGRHEVEDVFRVAAIYGIDGPPPACRVFAPVAVPPAPTLTIGIHISARKASQRWPAEHFADTIKAIAAQGPVRFMLLWSPGAEDNPLHPGDDAKAQDLLKKVGAHATVIARPTQTLPELIAALAECDALICADGGAMHLGAGLGLPIVCLFGNSGAARWRPWGVPYRLLQKPSLDVLDIPIDEVISAFNELSEILWQSHPSHLPPSGHHDDRPDQELAALTRQTPAATRQGRPGTEPLDASEMTTGIWPGRDK
ncbi:MAG: glycosyl transferase family protein [Rhodocyclaceae bacterium]|nr:MAG: glycosyl transferase family protein [Rhodocyclaceae bacterium]TND03156.1 MAG: glycosyl transferase family protein [Rhodocyclaceae bacterium]